MAIIPAQIALVGAGTIAAQYVESLRLHPDFEVVAICARERASAEAFAQRHALAAMTLGQLLVDPSINYVLNLTPAASHAAITHACLSHGKSVYSEKPLAATLEDADALITLAETRSLLLACAPATFLWPPFATAARLVREQRFGKIVGASTKLVYPGPEIFHPHPEHLYGAAAGPLYDMGVYQVTALSALLGPVVAVQAMTGQAHRERTVQVGPARGRRFAVDVPTHVHALLRHTSGAISSIIVSFDALSAGAPTLSIFGESGGLEVFNPHAPDAQLTLCDHVGERTAIVADGMPWSISGWAVGVTRSWHEFHTHAPVSASAARARDTLAILLAIEQSAIVAREVRLTDPISTSRKGL